MYKNKSMPTASTSAQAGPIKLFYGMEDSRENYEKNYLVKHKTLNTLRWIRIDTLNASLGLTMYYLLTTNIIYKIKNGINVGTQNTRKLIKDHPWLTEVEATDLLKSWSEYLKENYNYLSFSRMDKTVLDFLGKNTDSTNMGVNGSIGKDYKKAFDKLKNAFKKSNQGGHKTMRDLYFNKGDIRPEKHAIIAFVNAFFRKTSKLGLDWANSNSSQVSGVSFLNYHFNKNTGVYSDIMAEGQKKRERYTKSNFRDFDQSDTIYRITFSEIRHAMRKGYKPDDVGPLK